MSIGERGEYSAAASALGYFYQCRYALLDALRRLPEGDPVSIGIETLDDVVFQTGASAVDVLQTKHHINGAANLTDSSPDLWRTLRIWVELQNSEQIPKDTTLFLITTATCGDGTAASYLRPNAQHRDEKRAAERLLSTARTSTSETNTQAYSVFRALDTKARERLLQAVQVLDGSPSIGDLDEPLRQEVFYAVEREFLDAYIQRLEGWWYRRVVKHLQDNNPDPILGEELEAEASRIREEFKEDNLPIDDDIMSATVDATGYLGCPFVEQLSLIGVNQARVVQAIRNYYRAFEHRSRWLRENLLYVGDLDRYEERLIEEWEIQFQQMCDDLGVQTAEEHKVRAGQALYKWVESGMHQPIRPAITEPAIARGSYQMLADQLKVGWHLEFRERLAVLLSNEGSRR